MPQSIHFDSVRLAGLAVASYTATPDIAGEHDVARAVITRSDGWIIVTFPGTRPDHFWDDYTDLDADTIVAPRVGLVHAGFWSAMEGIAPRLDVVIGQSPCLMVGHSLGGAIATAYAARRTISGLPTWGLVTYGCPRIAIGQHLAATLSDVPQIRYRHRSDPVTHLPPASLVTGDWQHPTIETGLGVDTLADGWRLTLADLANPREAVEEYLGDHAITAYEAAIKLRARGQI